MGSQDTSGFAVEIDLWCFLLSSTSAKMRWEAVTRRDDVTWWDVWPIAHYCVASGEMITSTADCQRRKMDRHVRAWTFIFISTWVCSLESFVTEDGLRVYNIQLWIFLFVTSKSKETLWLCVLGPASVMKLSNEHIHIDIKMNVQARTRLSFLPRTRQKVASRGEQSTSPLMMIASRYHNAYCFCRAYNNNKTRSFHDQLKLFSG